MGWDGAGWVGQGGVSSSSGLDLVGAVEAQRILHHLPVAEQAPLAP